MKIVKSKINRMFNEQIASVGIRVLETVKQSSAEEAKKSLYVDQLTAVTYRFQKAIEPDDKLEKAAIKELFKSRKNSYLNIYDMAYGLTISRDAADKAAAVRIFSVLNKYGTKKFWGIRQSALTQRYAAFIETLQQPEFAADIERLKMTDLVAELKDAHEAYEKKYQEWGNQKSQRTPSAAMRWEMNNALKVVADEIEYLSKKYQTEAYVTLWKNIEQRFAEVYVTAPGSTLKESSTPATVPAQNSSVGS